MSEQSDDKVPTPPAESARLGFARLIVVLCFVYFFAAPFMHMFGADKGTTQQVAIAVIGALGIVVGWAFGSSMGSALKQSGIQSVIDRTIKRGS